MIYEELSRMDFIKRFEDYGRGNNFSYDARWWLYDRLNELSEETGQDEEFDAVAICCDWTEYEKFSDLVYDYGHIIDLPNDALETEENIEKIQQMLEENTTWTRLENGSWLIESF